jgi:hypothetical protein
MANEAKPGAGVIVRADFGGGIDQSMDAWRVPPSQLSALVNGRLERVGSVRKRTGYTALTPPIASTAQQPVAALSQGKQTATVELATDNAADNWTRNFVDQRIGNECRRVARSYAPGSAADWVTTGPVADVVADTIVLDGNAGNIAETVDYATSGEFIFVAKLNEPTSATSAAALTLTQYDRTTRAVISEKTLIWTSARVYVKLLAFDTPQALVVSVAHNSAPGLGTCEFFLYTFSASGLTFVTAPAPTVRQTTISWVDVTAFQGLPEQKYRPLCPFDVIKRGQRLFFVSYSASASAYRAELFDVSAVAITSVGNNDFKPAGTVDAHVLSACNINSRVAICAGEYHPAASPDYYTAANTNAVLIVLDMAAITVNAFSIFPITRTNAAARVAPGRVTVQQYKATDATEARVVGILEQLEYSAPGIVWTHQLVRVGIGESRATADDVLVRLSSAVPSSRMFNLQATTQIPSTDVLLTRMPVTVGASVQTFYGRDTGNPVTDFVSNYSSTIGTLAIVGPTATTLTTVAGPVQTIAPRLVPAPPPSPIQISGQWYVPQLVALDGSAGFGVALVRLTERSVGDVSPGSFGGLPVYPGGVLQQIDGERVGEVTLADRPHVWFVSATNAGAVDDFAAGDYLIQAVASYRDSAGNIHRSTPSDPYRMVVGGVTARTWTIYYSPTSYTNRNDVSIEFYVTETNGTILRSWFTRPNPTQGSVATFVVNDPQAGGTGLPSLDSTTIYTTGGVLPFVPVPSCRFATLFKNRLIVGGADDPKSVYYSNGPTAYQSANFAVGNVIRMEHESGCTAAGNVNDKLILFSANGVYASFGQFRDATGAGDALAELESIHDYIGCTQPVSVVSIPPGLIFFASDGRFYLIDERLGLNPIGLKVQDVTLGTGSGAFNVVQAAVHIEAEREVRFYMQDPLSLTAAALVYNYQVDQWSFDLITDPSTSSFPGSWAGACFSDALRCFVVTPSSYMQDNGQSYLDGTVYYFLQLRTAWIQPAGTQDYSRFRYAQILGRVADAHNLTMNVYCDFDETTVRATGTWTAAQLAPVSSTVYPEQVRLQVGTQKTQAIKIELYDAAPAGGSTGKGPQFVGLALEMLPLGGMRRLPDTRKR